MKLVEVLLSLMLVGFVTGLVVDQFVDGMWALRRSWRRRIGESRRVFPVISPAVLPYEGEGPGVYIVSGVLERTGALTNLRLDARSSAEALSQAFERGVSPAEVIKQRCDENEC